MMPKQGAVDTRCETMRAARATKSVSYQSIELQAYICFVLAAAAF